ncbi:NADH dehydrogenase (ubiquinone) complex I, assembly factor 6 [Coemansia guatemalensis]|uniref:NADH dehydrogenase (Ubiquinone) complex I, assembly factor 6 n=1 Tax=Coemansia guatemalensis TaxID=2761395 RepID=A0A9W8I0U5_9FUNG|nr:NADH dehydrogenase (ubiquinone) complex I, assembly factor 6 [Coemansia guatemalensis]
MRSLRRQTAQAFAFASGRYLSSGQPHVSRFVASPSDIEYCRQLVLKNDYDNYLVSLFSPKQAREAVWGVRALNVELVRVGDKTTSQAAAQMRYKYWDTAVRSLYSSNPTQTPVTRVVYDAIQRFGISKTWLRRLVSERERTLAQPKFATVADVEKYGERAYACLIHPHLEALGVRDMHADNAARAIGIATAIMNFTRSLPLLLGQGRSDLPLDIVERHKVDIDTLCRDPQPTPALREAVYEFATIGYTRLCGVAEIYVPSAPKAAFPALLAAVPVKEWFERLERADFNVFDRTLQRRSLRVIWRLWVASRRGTWIESSNRN